MEHTNNQITLRGTLLRMPEYSHESHGRKFYRLYLEIPRLSGNVDILPIVAEKQVLDAIDPDGGCMLKVEGQIRTHNSRTDGARRLLIFVYAKTIVAEDGEPVNDVMLEGLVCKEPIYRRTPLGREICDVMLAVPRGYHRADYLPCIAWGRTAQQIADCEIRDNVSIIGRLQSRVYTKLTDEGPQERIAYEISALTAHRIGSEAEN